MEHSKPLLNPLPLLPPISHKFLVFTCWVKCLTTQVFPRLADLEVNPGVCSILISMPLFTCIPFVFWNQGTQQGLFLREDKVLTWVGAQDVRSRDWDSWAASALAALVLDCLYTWYSLPLPVFVQQRVNNSYWHLWVQFQSYKAHCCSLIAIHLLFFYDFFPQIHSLTWLCIIYRFDTILKCRWPEMPSHFSTQLQNNF